MPHVLALRLVPIPLLLLALAGCRTISLLPQEDLAIFPPTECRLEVSDRRQTPAVLWVRRPDGILQTTLPQPLSVAVRQYACKAMSAKGRSTAAAVIMVDYQCVMSGFFNTEFHIDLRGHLIMPNRAPLEVRSALTQGSSSSLVSESCETASREALQKLATDISKAIEASPTSQDGQKT